MHEEAIRALAKAKRLIAAGDADSLRYACLELRTAIEHLFYELIPLYAEELPSDIVSKWQPAQIIAALVDCDPLVEEDTRICVFDYDENGEKREPHFLGEQKAVSRKLLQKYYHALGSYLHAPLAGKEHDYARLAKRLQETCVVVEDRCAGKLLANIAPKATFTCTCGRRIVRNMRAIEKSPIAKCPDANCGAMYEYVGTKDGMSTFHKLVEELTCEKCNTVNEFGRHQLRDGLVLACVECGHQVIFRGGYHAEPFQPDTSSGDYKRQRPGD
jgi:hypothetical protein